MSLQHDLFKYDLARHVISSIAWLQRLLYVPLHGPGSESPAPATIERNAPGERNGLLREYLEQVQTDPAVRMQLIQEYFGRESIEADLYQRRKAYATERKTQNYFVDLAGPRLKNAYLLVDPVYGLRVQGGADAHYIGLADLKMLHNRLGDDAVLVVCHHKGQGRTWKNEIIEKNQYLITFARYIAYICDGESAMIHLMRSQPQMKAVRAALDAYADRYTSLLVEYV